MSAKAVLEVQVSVSRVVYIPAFSKLAAADLVTRRTAPCVHYRTLPPRKADTQAAFYTVPTFTEDSSCCPFGLASGESPSSIR